MAASLVSCAQEAVESEGKPPPGRKEEGGGASQCGRASGGTHPPINTARTQPADTDHRRRLRRLVPQAGAAGAATADVCACSNPARRCRTTAHSAAHPVDTTRRSAHTRPPAHDAIVTEPLCPPPQNTRHAAQEAQQLTYPRTARHTERQRCFTLASRTRRATGTSLLPPDHQRAPAARSSVRRMQRCITRSTPVGLLPDTLQASRSLPVLRSHCGCCGCSAAALLCKHRLPLLCWPGGRAATAGCWLFDGALNSKQYPRAAAGHAGGAR
jgi:hypothetical protein